MFANPYTFLRYLSPEANSVLIANDADFSKVCDFLFFCAVSCMDDLLSDLYESALVELLENYEYKWRLCLSHVIAALNNLGIDHDSINDEEFMSELFLGRVEVLQQSKKDFKFEMPAVPPFVVGREKRPVSEYKTPNLEDGTLEEQEEEEEGNPYENFSEAARFCLIKRSVRLIGSLVTTNRDRTEFRPRSENWIPQLYLMYIFSLVGSDKTLSEDVSTMNEITLLLHFQFDTFSAEEWTGKKKSPSASDEPVVESACFDISEVLAQVGTHENRRKIQTWEENALPATKSGNFETLDHHHNIVWRLKLFPNSVRGNQIRKNVAFLNLQQLLNVNGEDDGEAELLPNASVIELKQFLFDQNAGNRLKPVGNEHYLMMSVVRLIDFVVGNENEDFEDGAKSLSVRKVKSELTTYSARMKEDINNMDISRLKEFLTQVTTRWMLMINKFADVFSQG